MRKRRPCIGLCHRNRVAKAKVSQSIFWSIGINTFFYLAGFARFCVEAPEAGGEGEKGEGERGEEREGGEGESFGDCWQRNLHLQKLNLDEEDFNRRILCLTLMLLEMLPIAKETNKEC